MSKVHLLTVAYSNDQYKKREESIKISFTWISAFPSKPYTIGDDGILHGQPFKVFVTEETNKIYLYLGQRELAEDGEVNQDIPVKLLKVFSVEKSKPLNTELVIQVLQCNDGTIEVRVLNDDVKISVLGTHTNEGKIIPPELPSELPEIPTPQFKPFDFYWILDGTLASAAFQKCIGTAVLLTDIMRHKTNLRVGYYCFGEYSELFLQSHYPIMQNTYKLLSCELTDNLDRFKVGIRSLEPMQVLTRDDPSSCLELAMRELANKLEAQTIPNQRDTWVFIMGNSLPHYKIDEIFQSKIHLIPTEEFENIYWKDELDRIRQIRNVRIQPVWINDQSTEKKWAEIDSSGRKVAQHQARAWWKSILSEGSSFLEMTDSINPSEMASILYDLIWQLHPPKMTLIQPSPYPLAGSLDELKVYID